MNRVMLFAMFCLLLCPVGALAADGNHAVVTITVTMDSSMFGAEGEDMPDMPEMDPMVMGGDMYWTDDAMRFEISGEMMPGTMVSLVDYKEMVAYSLDPDAKTAMKVDLDQQMDDMEGMGMPSFDPEQMFTNWEETLAVLKETPGIVVEELGTETVGEWVCNKISFTMDSDAMAEDSDMSAEEAAMMGMMGEFAGTYWINEDVKLPVRMEMAMMGMKLDWLVDNITDWVVDPAMLAVPAGYKVTTYEEMMEEMMGEMGEMEAGDAA